MTRTILLADDSVTIQKVVELTFMDEDFRVVSAGNGSDAIDQLAELRPDVVIADVHMPGADGYEVSRRTRESLPATPVLLLVGTFEAFDADRAAESGASGYLKKPFDSQELLRRVRELIATPAPALPRASAQPAPLEMAEEEPLWTPEPPETSGSETWRAPEPPPAVGDWSLEAPPASPGWQLEPAPSEIPEPEPAPVEAPIDFAAPIAPRPVLAEASPAPEPSAPAAILAAPGTAGELSEADVDRIARRVIDLLGEKVVRDVAWEVVPDLAEVILKARIRELEASVE